MSKSEKKKPIDSIQRPLIGGFFFVLAENLPSFMSGLRAIREKNRNVAFASGPM